jgi:hypothetical protein
MIASCQAVTLPPAASVSGQSRNSGVTALTVSAGRAAGCCADEDACGWHAATATAATVAARATIRVFLHVFIV